MSDDTPVLDTIADMTAASIARCGLHDDQLILVRLAALAAVDARPVSYLAHVSSSVEAGVSLEQVQDVLIAVAPIIGTARVIAASEHIAEALGLAIAVVEAEIDAGG